MAGPAARRFQTRGSSAEAAGVAALGAVAAALTGSVVDLAAPAAIVGGLNGVISGWRRTYSWRQPTGTLALVLDSTWALPMTAAGLLSNGVGLIQRNSGFVPELSERSNRHVYRRGFVPRKGFAITVGSVISGAGDVDRPRRARLVTVHEDVHVWQARWFGPLFPLLYGGWALIGAVVGMVRWLTDRRKRGDRLASTVESAAYYLNPFEWWAYSRDANWPPSGKVVGFGWAKPCCAPGLEVRVSGANDAKLTK